MRTDFSYLPPITKTRFLALEVIFPRWSAIPSLSQQERFDHKRCSYVARSVCKRLTHVQSTHGGRACSKPVYIQSKLLKH